MAQANAANIQRRDERIADIAAAILYVPTLETRKSDGLDFHDVAVWQIKEALELAYAEGHDAQVANAAN